MTCTITGYLRAPDGSALPDTAVTIHLQKIAGTADGAAMPKEVTATSNGSGLLTLNLLPGTYRLRWSHRGVCHYAKIGVPDAPSADLGDLLDHPESFTPAVAQVAADLLAEQSARQAGDLALSNRIDAEQSARQAGDLALRSDILAFAEGFPSDNLYNPAARRDGWYVNVPNGRVMPVAGWACTEYIPVTPGEKYTVSAAGNRQGQYGFYAAPVDNVDAIAAGTLPGDGQGTITAPAGAAWMALTVHSPTKPEPPQLMINLGAEALPYVPFGTIWKIKPAALPQETAALHRLVWPSTGKGLGFVESARAGFRLRNSFSIQHPELIASGSINTRVNPRDVMLNGVVLRVINDDVAPDRAMGGLIGGNHSVYGGRCTAPGHGKTAADEGSVWSIGGVQYVLVQVEAAGTLVLFGRTASDDPPTGTYTHVSGASNTASFVVESVLSRQVYPPHTNYRLRVLVDGVVVDPAPGQEFAFDRSVQLIETCDFIDRSQMAEWWIANGGWQGGYEPQVTDPYYTVTTTHSYDRDGQLTVLKDYLFLRATPFSSIYGLQAARVNNPIGYYIPTALPVVYDGETLDYSTIVASDRTVGKPNLDFMPANFQPTGLCGDRVLSLWSDAVFAMGFLPVGDAAVDVRRSRVSNLAFRILGTSGKLYHRLLDKGDFTAAAGERYSMIGYRHVFPRVAARTASYVVRTEGSAYLFADWHDFAGLDRIDVPDDLMGRAFTVVDSRNASISPGILTGSVAVTVAAGSGGNGWLVLEVS